MRTYTGLIVLTLLAFTGCEGALATLNDVPFEDEGASADGLLSLLDAQLIDVGSGVKVAVWENRLGAQRDESAFSVQRGSANFSAAKRTRFELVFRDHRVDPKTEPSSNSPASLQVVQFYSTVLPEYLEALMAAGAEPLQPFPRDAYVVRMSEQARAALASAPYIRAISPFGSALRTDLGGFDGDRPRVYQVLPATQRAEDKSQLLAELQRVGAEVNLATVSQYLVEATMNGEQLRAIAGSPFVLHVDPWSEGEVDVDKARELSGANFIENTLGFSGQGVRGEVMDGNVLDTHSDLKGRVIFHGPHDGDNSHGTCTTGLVFGNGTGRAAARGMLPNGQPIFADYDKLGQADGGVAGRDRRTHTAELLQPEYQASFQSNSWGSALTTDYTAVSAELDSILFDLDFLLFNSQSNSGSRNSRPQAWAKNVVSIGGVKHQDTLTLTDDRWDNGGSIGPASDGRIKPDLSHFWDRTLAPANTGAYDENFGGTSGATPMTAGLAGLFLQMWSNGVFGNPTPGTTVFANRPHFTTSKAVLINTATQWAFSGATHDLTRVHQGWGRVDLKRLYDLRSHLLIINETELLTAGTSAVHTVNVAANTPELRATLTWADPAGLPSAGIHRVNDLTLKVTDPAGVVYFGNNGLLAGMFSTSGGTANSIDTVENVFVQNPVAGKWIIEVRADEIAKDGHIETPALDADFALVVSGIETGAVGTPPTVQVTAPVEGQQVSGVITVSATAKATGSTIDHVRFGLPNGTFVDAKAPLSLTFDTSTVANGPAQFTAVAFDSAGLSSSLATVNVTVKNGVPNQAPTISLAGPTGTVSGKVTFTATASDPDGTVASVTFVWPDGSSTVDTSAPYAADLDTAVLPNGVIKVSAFATDALGAKSDTASTSVTVSNSTAWSGAMAAKTTIVDDTTTCAAAPVTFSGDSSTVLLTFTMKHTYRKALAISLRHGSQSAVIIKAGDLSASSGTVQRTKLKVPGFTGSARGDWSLCVQDTDTNHHDTGTINTYSVKGTGTVP